MLGRSLYVCQDHTASTVRGEVRTRCAGQEGNTARRCLVQLQLETLGKEVVRVAGMFAGDRSLHRESECAQAAESVASVA